MNDDAPWLLFDCDYVAHRAYYAIGHLEFDGMATEIPYGFLREIINQQYTHTSGKVAFCFDKGESARKKIYPAYKTTRCKNITTDDFEWNNKRELKKQIHFLRDEYLGEIGYKNIFSQDGYEADDIIASICQNLPEGQKAIIISADKDLLQLLEEDRIEVWDLRKKQMITEKSFTKEWGIEPLNWVRVKAIAGCTSDNVKGVDGIGEKKAISYIRGEMKPHTMSYKNILDNNDVISRNLSLVCLPFLGMSPIKVLEEDKISRSQWMKATKRLGMSFERGVW